MGKAKHLTCVTIGQTGENHAILHLSASALFYGMPIKIGVFMKWFTSQVNAVNLNVYLSAIKVLTDCEHFKIVLSLLGFIF